VLPLIIWSNFDIVFISPSFRSQTVRLMHPWSPTSTHLGMPSPAFILFMFIEAGLIGTTLFLFSYGYPDATRKALWEEGGRLLFNSDPKLRIYFYANHLEPPDIPFIWSQRLVLNILISRFPPWKLLSYARIRSCLEFDLILESATSTWQLRSLLFGHSFPDQHCGLWDSKSNGLSCF